MKFDSYSVGQMLTSEAGGMFRGLIENRRDTCIRELLSGKLSGEELAARVHTAEVLYGILTTMDKSVRLFCKASNCRLPVQGPNEGAPFSAEYTEEPE